MYALLVNRPIRRSSPTMAAVGVDASSRRCSPSARGGARRREAVRLRDDQRAVAADDALAQRRARARTSGIGARVVRSRPRRTGCRGRSRGRSPGGLVAGAVDRVLAVAEEDEVVVGEPLQELGRLLAPRRPSSASRPPGPSRSSPSIRSSIARKSRTAPAHVAEHAHEVVASDASASASRRRSSLEVHHRLARGASRAGRIASMRPSLAALDADHRVHDRAHLQPVHVHLGADRVDEERRVVDADLDHRAAECQPSVPVSGLYARTASSPGARSFMKA